MTQTGLGQLHPGAAARDFKFEVEFLALLLSVRDGLGSDLGR
ncbi:hypothetical protein AAHB34_10235 [Paenarthrobacter ureafaciens]